MSWKHRLGDLQLAIMRFLWRQGPVTVAEVHASLLESRGLAPTTVATMLRKMESKGIVTHDVRGRSFIYRPTIAEHEVNRSMVGDLVDRLFAGDATALVNHLLTEGDIDPADIDELRRRIEDTRGEQEGDAS